METKEKFACASWMPRIPRRHTTCVPLAGEKGKLVARLFRSWHKGQCMAACMNLGSFCECPSCRSGMFCIPSTQDLNQ